ncbi:MAG: BatD family protein, partial [Colwellia sp.]
MVRNFSMHVTTKGLFYPLQSLMLTILIMATFLLSNNVYALSKVTAVVDKNPAMINESILLTVTADDDVNRNALDTSPLLSDFIVGQTSVSSQTSMVNFKTSRLTKWQIVLIARSAGQFIIPALTIENQQSEPVELTVVAAKDTSSNSQTDIFVTSELSRNEVYVQQLLTLSIKLHFSVELKSGNLTEPS